VSVTVTVSGGNAATYFSVFSSCGSRECADQATGNSSDLICEFHEFFDFFGIEIAETLGNNQLSFDLQERTTRVSPAEIDSSSWAARCSPDTDTSSGPVLFCQFQKRFQRIRIAHGLPTYRF
jgi:hypothetical protein